MCPFLLFPESVLSTQFTFFCWQTLAKWPILLQLLHCAFKALHSFMCLVLTNWRIASVAFFCREFCFFVSKSFIRISTNFIYFTTRYFLFSCSSALMFHFFLTNLGKVPIFNHSLFANVFVSCFNNYLVTNHIFLSTVLQPLSHSQNVHVFSAALILLQKALKVSFLT